MLSRWLTSPTLRALARVLLVVLVVPAPLWAQAPPAGQGPPAFKPEELEQIVAPIALYPDPLLAQVLMASTYPLELVEAARFAKANPTLKGDAARRGAEAADVGRERQVARARFPKSSR